MATALTETVTLAEYLSRTWHADREWVDGELRERNMGDGIHSVVQGFLIWFFRAHEEQWQVKARPELRVRVAANNFRIPDVLLKRIDTPFELIVTTPPLLCIEVLSPDDRMRDIVEKMEDYFRMGVPAVWVIDPRRRTAMMSTGGALEQVEVLTVPGTEIALSMAQIVREIDAETV